MTTRITEVRIKNINGLTKEAWFKKIESELKERGWENCNIYLRGLLVFKNGIRIKDEVWNIK